MILSNYPVETNKIRFDIFCATASFLHFILISSTEYSWIKYRPSVSSQARFSRYYGFYLFTAKTSTQIIQQKKKKYSPYDRCQNSLLVSMLPYLSFDRQIIHLALVVHSYSLCLNKHSSNSHSSSSTTKKMLKRLSSFINRTGENKRYKHTQAQAQKPEKIN